MYFPHVCGIYTFLFWIVFFSGIRLYVLFCNLLSFFLMCFLIRWENICGIPSEKSKRWDYTNSMISISQIQTTDLMLRKETKREYAKNIDNLAMGGFREIVLFSFIFFCFFVGFFFFGFSTY